MVVHHLAQQGVLRMYSLIGAKYPLNRRAFSTVGECHAGHRTLQPTPPLRHYRPEKALVVQLVLPRKWAVLRQRGYPRRWMTRR
jgi:hypothetical protein